MSGGGGGGSQTVKNEPWAGAKPYLLDLFGNAQDLYTGTSGNLDPWGTQSAGTRVNQAQNFLGGSLGQVAGQYGLGAGDLRSGVVTGVMPRSAAGDAAHSAGLDLANDPLSPLYHQASNTVGDLMSGAFGGTGRNALNITQGVAQDPGGRNAARAGDYLDDAARGDYLGAGNPYMKQMVDAASRPVVEQFNTQVLPALQSQFVNAGQPGSDQMRFAATQAAEGLGRNLADMSANMYGQQYGQERQLQQQAAGALGQLGLSQSGQRLDAAGQLAGIKGAEVGAQLQAAGLAPGLAQSEYGANLQNVNLLGQIGAADTAQGQQLINQVMGTYGGAQQAPWQELINYSNLITGNPAAGLTQQTTPMSGGNPILGGLGGAASGAAIGSMFGPFGMGIGAGLGGLGGLFL